MIFAAKAPCSAYNNWSAGEIASLRRQPKTSPPHPVSAKAERPCKRRHRSGGLLGADNMREKAPREIVTCGFCGRQFMYRISRKRKFCGKICANAAQANRYRLGRYLKKCIWCGKLFDVPPRRRFEAKYCSFLCKQKHVAVSTAGRRSALLAGKTLHGGPVKPTTYLKHRGHHLHREIAEKMLGRKLERGEIVHHLDGNKHNNIQGNLVVTTQSIHATIHSTKKNAGVMLEK